MLIWQKPISWKVVKTRFFSLLVQNVVQGPLASDGTELPAGQRLSGCSSRPTVRICGWIPRNSSLTNSPGNSVAHENLKTIVSHSLQASIIVVWSFILNQMLHSHQELPSGLQGLWWNATKYSILSLRVTFGLSKFPTLVPSNEQTKQTIYISWNGKTWIMCLLSLLTDLDVYNIDLISGSTITMSQLGTLAQRYGVSHPELTSSRLADASICAFCNSSYSFYSTTWLLPTNYCYLHFKNSKGLELEK